MKTRILYVEDDADLRFVTQDNLRQHGYEVVGCDNGKTALAVFREYAFDLCILDVMLPEMDGFTLAREIRRENEEVPILFLTAKSLPEDRLAGLRIGADDYLTKPFAMEELLLKIEIFLKRRKLTVLSGQRAIPIGEYSLDFENLTLLHPVQGPKRLTQKEADLLRLLCRKRNEVVRRAEVLETLWGKNDYFLGRSLDVFISRLRKYLKADSRLRIDNIHGIGFLFVCP
ncbi:MAG: response regulator transcription factor [Saprospiraceae bacterium]|jgi:two-component system response regulator VicR